MKKIVFLFILFIQSITFAQVKFEAKVSKSSVGLNERIQISFSINEDADNFTEPNFEGFSVVGGPFQSTNFSWINGVKSFNRSYTYILTKCFNSALSVSRYVWDYTWMCMDWLSVHLKRYVQYLLDILQCSLKQSCVLSYYFEVEF